jgi:SpoVK/Ycf46/Vps4 family AAA+-type ATPase
MMNENGIGKEIALPDWANELKKRYLRGEASLFVLHGNVYDAVWQDDKQLSLTDFLINVVLKSNKDLIGVFNIATGFRLAHRKTILDNLEAKLAVLNSFTASHSKTQWLEALEVLLANDKPNVTARNALIVEYAEALTPAGDPSFQADVDRAAIVTLHRWSFLPSIIEQDNIIILLAENLSELSPKIISNPRLSTIEIPLPDFETRLKTISLIDAEMPENDQRRYAEMTAGLKLIQINTILKPHKTPEVDLEERTEFIGKLLGTGESVPVRAAQLAQLTADKSREEIVNLLAPDNKQLINPDVDELEQKAKSERDRLIFERKREIIERECFGLLEFIEPNFNFEAIGGLDAVKEDLRFVARNMRDGFYNRVPMGMLFTGAQGTGKTFFATAFAGEARMTAVKLKNFRSKWVGATEGNLEKILSVIKSLGQTIVIIDEADRSFGAGGESEGDDGTSSRVVAKMKEFMSDTTNRGRVLFVLMTNRPDLLDVDLKRAGRLDRKIPFFYPQNETEVLAIARAVNRKNRLNINDEVLEKSGIWQQMVSYSAADIEAVLLLAHETAAKQTESVEPVTISSDLLQAAFADYFPSRDTTMLKFMELQAVFECSNRKLLPEKYAAMTAEELQSELESLRLIVGNRR